MESNQFFATAKPTRLFLRVALPGMISMLAMSVYNVIEGALIGNLLGETAFAAVNIAMPFVMINFALADLVGVGSSVPISISLGRGDKKTANNYFSCSVILIFVTAVIMGVVLFALAPSLVRFLGADGALAEFAASYVRVYALMGPVSTLLFAMDNYLRISGFVKGSMILNIGMSCLTAVLIYAFIGILGMSVVGSALATCLSMAVCVLIALIPFLSGRALLRFSRPRLSLAMLKRIVLCGLPIFLNNIAGRVASIILNIALIGYGGQTAVAAYSVLMYASFTFEPLFYGMSDSVQPAIGYNWGARSLERVKAISKATFVGCGIVGVIGTAAMLAFPEFIAGLFVSADDKVLMELSVRAMRIFCFAMLFRWFGFAVQGFFSAIEKPIAASVLSVASALVFPVLFVFVLAPLKLDGLWLNYGATALCVAIIALFMILRAQKKMKEDILK